MEGTLSLPFRMGILAAGLSLWLILYFSVKQINVAPNKRVDMITSIDQKMPFVPWMALVYFSTYIFVLLPFILYSEARTFWGILAAYVAVTAISTLFHIFLPSRIQRIEDLPEAGISEKALGMFQRLSKPHDNFPSMHVAFSVLVVGANFTQTGTLAGVLALVWAVLIALSTMFTKQHYITDVLAGTVNGILIFSLAYLLVIG